MYLKGWLTPTRQLLLRLLPHIIGPSYHHSLQISNIVVCIYPAFWLLQAPFKDEDLADDRLTTKPYIIYTPQKLVCKQYYYLCMQVLENPSRYTIYLLLNEVCMLVSYYVGCVSENGQLSFLLVVLLTLGIPQYASNCSIPLTESLSP